MARLLVLVALLGVAACGTLQGSVTGSFDLRNVPKETNL